VGSMTAIGEVADRNIIILDDMIDTAGTITKAAEMMMSKGARSVRAIATHPVLSGLAYSTIANSSLEEVIVTDTIPLSCNPDVNKDKIKVLSIAREFADIIDKVYNFQSISSKFTL